MNFYISDRANEFEHLHEELDCNCSLRVDLQSIDLFNESFCELPLFERYAFILAELDRSFLRYRDLFQYFVNGQQVCDYTLKKQSFHKKEFLLITFIGLQPLLYNIFYYLSAELVNYRGIGSTADTTYFDSL